MLLRAVRRAQPALRAGMRPVAVPASVRRTMGRGVAAEKGARHVLCENAGSLKRWSRWTAELLGRWDRWSAGVLIR